MPPSSVCYYVAMRLTIETTARLPYGLVPSPDYTPARLVEVHNMWMEYINGNMDYMTSGIVCRPNEDEARERGYPEEIGQSRLVQFRDIRSILVEAK